MAVFPGIRSSPFHVSPCNQSNFDTYSNFDLGFHYRLSSGFSSGSPENLPHGVSSTCKLGKWWGETLPFILIAEEFIDIFTPYTFHGLALGTISSTFLPETDLPRIARGALASSYILTRGRVPISSEQIQIWGARDNSLTS